ncbi:MAG: phosphoadenylyl-sulfate reductase [Bacteroidia bacterium]|nr:phosphoadenylyl-sulfate reductase [Bacteroidia bacterium]
MNSKNSIDFLTREYRDKTILETLQLLAEKFKNKIVFSTSFSYEDQMITDIIFSNNLPVKVFTIDTGRLFYETYKVFNSTLGKYKKPIRVFYPDFKKVEKIVTEKGPFSFYESIENRLECCHARKVEPLKRALKGMNCWITGLRSDQSPARQLIASFEWDEANSILKYNPLCQMSFEEVKKYIKANHIPYNILHDKKFISIGCAPCTRAIEAGEDFRAGRWWWESNTKKECGLHNKKK